MSSYEHLDLNLDLPALKHAATISRGLSMDAVAICKSGHLGLPLGCADIGSVLFGNLLSYHPVHDKWINRDR
ncbi:transketolase 1, partial [Chytriomyces hyalinus]